MWNLACSTRKQLCEDSWQPWWIFRRYSINKLANTRLVFPHQIQGRPSVVPRTFACFLWLCSLYLHFIYFPFEKLNSVNHTLNPVKGLLLKTRLYLSGSSKGKWHKPVCAFCCCHLGRYQSIHFKFKCLLWGFSFALTLDIVQFNSILECICTFKVHERPERPALALQLIRFRVPTHTLGCR